MASAFIFQWIYPNSTSIALNSYLNNKEKILIMVKYAEHKICHYNHFQVYN